MSPYTVTTKRNCEQCRGFQFEPCLTPEVSRCAVATLEDDSPLTRDGWGARRLAGSIVNEAGEQVSDDRWPDVADAYDQFEAACWALPASGGTVGPLPDGTVIEVEPGPGQQDMRQALREWGVSMDTRDALDDTIVFAWVEHFNAKQAA